MQNRDKKSSLMGCVRVREGPPICWEQIHSSDPQNAGCSSGPQSLQSWPQAMEASLLTRADDDVQPTTALHPPCLRTLCCILSWPPFPTNTCPDRHSLSFQFHQWCRGTSFQHFNPGMSQGWNSQCPNGLLVHGKGSSAWGRAMEAEACGVTCL